MTLLILWSFQLSGPSFSKTKETNPMWQIGKLLGLDTPLQIRKAPQGVNFSPTNAYVTFSKDSKKPWLILSGHAINSSVTPISSIEIVTILYDKDQNIISKETSFIPNYLTIMDFNSLTDEDIIEKSKNSTTNIISQGTSKSAVIAIKDNPKAKWFASRVYSTICEAE
jgi:hypothetical protein